METLIYSNVFAVTMPTSMDRDFGDDPFRKMERKKAARKAGIPELTEETSDIEDPIVTRTDQ